MYFMHPWILLLAIPGALLTVWLVRDTGKRRRLLRHVMNMLVVCLIVTAAAGPRILSHKGAPYAIFLVDTSDSVQSYATNIRQLVKDKIAFTTQPAMTGIASFNQRATVTMLPRQLGKSESISILPAKAGDLSDIGAGIEAAVGIIPTGRRGQIILFTDGNDTSGKATQAAAIAADRGISIFPYVLSKGEINDVRVEQIEAPSLVREGEPVAISAVIRTTHPRQVAAALYRGEIPIAEQQIEMSGGGTARAEFYDRPAEAGVYTYKVAINNAEDAFPQNDRGMAIVTVGEQLSVLFLSGHDNNHAALRILSEIEDTRIETRRASFDISPIELSQFDCVVVNNLPAENLSGKTGSILRDFVRDAGGGLLVLGGEQSFGPGGYGGTSIEEALPVWTEPEPPQMALMLVLDRSGSMGQVVAGQSKLAIVQRAVADLVSSLRPRDEIGIIAFDVQPHTVKPLEAVGNGDGIKQAMLTLSAKGGTDIFAALTQAAEIISTAQSTEKHVILLSDGRSQPGELQSILDVMRKAGTSVSAVAASGDVDRELLTAITAGTGGRLYDARELSSLANILRREVRAAQYIAKERIYPTSAPDSDFLLGKLAASSLPPVNGYTRTNPKEKARTVLSADGSSPLLATWQYGLGRSAVFTSAFDKTWGREWLEWENTAIFLDQLVRWCAGPAREKDLQVTTRHTGGECVIEARPSRHADSTRHLDLKARIINENMETDLKQVGPDRYRGALPLYRPGIYTAVISKRTEQGEVVLARTPIAIAYSPEWQRVGSNDELLEKIAELTRGKVLRRASDLLSLPQKSIADYTQVGWMLLLLATLFFIVSIFL